MHFTALFGGHFSGRCVTIIGTADGRGDGVHKAQSECRGPAFCRLESSTVHMYVL